MTLIGLYGDSRCGKDTVAEMLKGYGFEQRIMADPIREILLRINPYVADIEPRRLADAVRDIGWDGVKAYFPEAVDYMINLGQAARDIISPTVWLAPALRGLGDRTVISDIRQPNEYGAIKGLGGEVWKITRPGTVPRGMDRLLDHLEFDATIDNNGTLSELAIKVDHQLWRLRVSEADQKAAD